MNVNKKFQAFQQWGKGKMGGAANKDGLTDDFKALEQEMNMRHQGLEKMHASMTAYVKSLSKRSEGDGREKQTAIGYLGSAMSRHGEVYEEGNRFGESLVCLGQANERLARFQDSYASNATTSWLEALERSLAQMKDYQKARKRLDDRRAAYDSSLVKSQKAKSGDYRAEEELRTQKAKYEESTEDVTRRMQDIIESEQDNTTDLYAFVEAELNYHDRCREVMLQLKRNWPGGDTSNGSGRPAIRSRHNTLSRVPSAGIAEEEEDDADLAPPSLPFRGGARTPSGSSTPYSSSPLREAPGFDFGGAKPSLSRTTTNDNTTTSTSRSTTRLGSIDPSTLRASTASPLRPIRQRPSTAGGSNHPGDVFGDPSAATAVDDDYTTPTSDSYSYTRSSSPATSISQGSRTASFSQLEMASSAAGQNGQRAKKAPPPPPPPSRGSKPPPPPPPMKRSALSSSSVPSAYS